MQYRQASVDDLVLVKRDSAGRLWVWVRRHQCLGELQVDQLPGRKCYRAEGLTEVFSSAREAAEALAKETR